MRIGSAQKRKKLAHDLSNLTPDGLVQALSAAGETIHDLVARAHLCSCLDRGVAHLQRRQVQTGLVPARRGPVGFAARRGSIHRQRSGGRPQHACPAAHPLAPPDAHASRFFTPTKHPMDRYHKHLGQRSVATAALTGRGRGTRRELAVQMRNN